MQQRSVIKTLIIDAIYWSMRLIRPILGPPGGCRYTVTCTLYAKIQLQQEPTHKAIWNIIKRVVSCR